MRNRVKYLGLWMLLIPSMSLLYSSSLEKTSSWQIQKQENVEASHLVGALTLKEAQSYLLAHHPQLLAQKASEESARQVYLQAWSAWLPSVSASASYADDSLPGHYTTGVGLNQTLFENSSYWNVRLKKIDWAIAKANFAALKNDLLYELRLSYYGLIVTRQEVQAAQENVDLLQASYEREKSRFELGDTTSFQMNQSKVALSSALADLYAARALHKKAYQRLYVAMGMEPSCLEQKIELKESEIPVDSIGLIRDLLVDLENEQNSIGTNGFLMSADKHPSLFSDKLRLQYVNLALADAPAIRIAKADVDKNRMTIQSRYGEYLPSLSANASYNNGYSRGQSGPFDGKYDAAASVSLQWTLVDGLARERKLAQSKWDRLAGDEKLRQLVHRTKQGVLGDFYEIEQALQTYVASKMSVQLAEDAMKQADHQRTWGVISPLEYREAASLLTRSRKDFAKSGYQLMQAYYQLIRTTGQDVASDYVQIEEVMSEIKESGK